MLATGEMRVADNIFVLVVGRGTPCAPGKKRKATARRGLTLTTNRIRRSAFTLVELMVVIAIIGIMVAMIIPEMRGTYEDALLRSTSRDLVNVFELASSRAISLNQLHRVRLDPESSRYVVERRVRSGGAEDFVPLTDVSGCEGELDKRISIQIQRQSEDGSAEANENSASQLDPIAFNPDGTADSALILLQDRSGFRLALRVNPITSRINVFEMERQ